MPRISQDGANSTKEPGSAEPIALSGPVDTHPGKRRGSAETEEIPRAEIIIEAEGEASIDETGDVPLFRTENDGATGRSPLIVSEAEGKIAVPKSVMPPVPRHASDTSPQSGTLPENEFRSMATEQPDEGFPDIQPPLAILTIAFLVLMFLLW